MINCKMIPFKVRGGEKGTLIPLEHPAQLPFELNRIYYIYGVGPEDRRGFHSHNELEQILIAVHGSVKILVKTPYEEEIVELNSPSEGLYIGPMIWREMFAFQDEAVLLVLASEKYNEADYVRDYATYEEKAKIYFKGEKR